MARLIIHIGKRCPYCDREMSDGDLAPTRDHYPVPRSHGGARTVICCITCNGIKGDMTAAEWHAYMALHPQWWLKPPPKGRLPRRRGVRFIVQDETPSAPLRDAMLKAEQARHQRMLSLGFEQMTRGRRRR